MALWIFLVLGVALINGFVNILDKHVVSSEVRDPVFCTTFWTIVNFVLMLIVFLIAGQKFVFNTSAIYAIIAGAVAAIAVIFYYKALKSEEVSRVLPMLAIVPLFVLLISTIFLGESFGWIKYLAIFFLVAGAFLISVKNFKHFKISKVLGIVLLSALFFSLRTPITRVATFGLNFWQTSFYTSVGLLIVGLILWIFHHPTMKSRAKIKGLEYLFLANAIGVGAILLGVWALTLAQASLVSALNSVQDLFVFILAIFFAKEGFIKEHLSKKTIVFKIIAIALIIAGSILIG